MKPDDSQFERALQPRLKRAFAQIRAPDELARSISDRLADPPAKPKIILFVRRVIPWAMAAAAIIVIAPLIYNLATTQSLQAELAAMHEAYMDRPMDCCAGLSREELTGTLMENLAETPLLPKGDDVKFCGCCKPELKGISADGYMAEVSGLVVSIVITEASPESLKFGKTFQRNDQDCFACSHGRCKMVSARLGRYTYIVVGNGSHDQLANILKRLSSAPAG